MSEVRGDTQESVQAEAEHGEREEDIVERREREVGGNHGLDVG